MNNLSNSEPSVPRQGVIEAEHFSKSSRSETTAWTTPIPATPDLRGAEIYTLYLREIGQVPLLTAEAELELAARTRQGDEAARERMITANLRLVVKIARAWEGFGLPLLDLISEGNIGLMKGVERFDPTKGARLSSYAAWSIKQSIRRAIYNQGKTVRLPIPVAEKLIRMRRVSSRLEEELGREPTDGELAEEMHVPAHKVAQLRSAGLRTVSLDAPMHDDNDDTFVACIPDENIQTPAQELEACGDSEMLRAAAASLTSREQLVLNRRFGLEDGVERTLEEVSAILGLTRERVRQIQNEAIVKLRRGVARFEAAGATEAVRAE